MSASRRKHEAAFKAKVALRRAARAPDGGGAGGAFRGASAPDLCLEEALTEAATKMFASQLGRSEEVSERRLAELTV
jgi:hypothetical protein